MVPREVGEAHPSHKLDLSHARSAALHEARVALVKSSAAPVIARRVLSRRTASDFATTIHMAVSRLLSSQENRKERPPKSAH